MPLLHTSTREAQEATREAKVAMDARAKNIKNSKQTCVRIFLLFSLVCVHATSRKICQKRPDRTNQIENSLLKKKKTKNEQNCMLIISRGNVFALTCVPSADN